MGGSSNCHARSNSLPTRPHPLVTECDEHLCRLKALDSAPWTAPAMVKKLAGLQDLQECVNKLLLLRRTMEAFAAQRREKWVDEIFDGSLRLLDLCSAAKDGVIHTKECVRELQSLVRRRSSFSGSCGNGVANQVCFAIYFRLETTNLHNCMIFSTLSISSDDFVLINP